MADKICHLCETHYNDDLFFQEQPSHTPEHCLGLLKYLLNEAERKLSEADSNLARATKEYHK